ncbi:hypothetical protein QYE76_058489 [Lolium multiflorum]|uniref:Uncharacterized protein n=1 Tax=Lolium multiflorum TaxID=4521 RepID=A0AAD8WSH7_LOLMU|nr:hypothetical protein QYE76_058489 [Lolium multiflorum]
MLWGPTAPFASFSSRTPSSRKPKPRGILTKVTAACGAENTERKELSGGQESAGKFPPGGEIDAIAIVIERDIISIIVIIISTIYTAITTAAPRTVSLDSQHKRLERLNHQLHKMDLPSADMPIDDGKTKLYLLQNAKDRCLYYSQLEAARNYCTEEEEEEEEEEEDEDGKEYDAEFDDDKTGQGKYEEEQYAQEQYEEEEHAPAQSRTEEANQEIKGTKGKKKEGVRGPTEMKKFWEKHGPDNKVELVFNHLGQPCGVKTSKLANFIGSCVKGKEVSMGHDEWRKVPESEKDRLWTVVKGFFNIGDEHKDWVMKSASKKWRTFRAHLKDTYFDDELSLSQNIKNGCDERIPEMQWKKSCKYWKSVKFFRLSVKNKASRRSQDNAHHTAGSRSFAVVLEQEELKKKRPVSRAELYSIVHTNNKGQPVDTYSSTKIAAIKEELGKNPELISEAHHQGDIYSKIFPETRKSRMHGLGLMVGGKTSQILDQAIVALKDSKDENKELREMIRTMAESHKALVIRSQAMEEKIEGLILSQQQVSTQATTTFPASNDGEPSNTQEAGKRSTSQEVNHAVTNIQSLSLVKPKRAAVINAQEDKKEDQSVPAPALVLKVDKSAVTAALKVKEQDKETATETLEDDQRDSGDLKKRPRKKKLEDIPEGKKRQYMVHKVKLEKLKENSAASLKCKPHKENEIHAFKRGMEVSLRSPNSLQLVASATVSNVDDKETGPDYVEVLVNYVMKKSTMLPRPHGKIKKMSSAQATCILWPRIHMNVVTQSEIVHQQIWKGHDEERSRVDKDGVSVVVEKTKKLKRGSTDMSQNEVVEAAELRRGPPLHEVPPPLRESVVFSSVNFISLKVRESDVGFPIHVFGTLIARDHVDYRCVYLFRREEDHAQIITSPDDTLTLMDPCRGLVPDDSVYFEFNLKIKCDGGAVKDFSRGVTEFNSCRLPGVGKQSLTVPLTTCLSRVELLCADVTYPLEAYISINILKGTCDLTTVAAWNTKNTEDQIILYDSRAAASNQTSKTPNSVALARRVVAVPLDEKLVIHLVVLDGDETEDLFLILGPSQNEHKHVCKIGCSEVQVKVAWTAVPKKRKICKKWETIGNQRLLL